MAAVTQTLMNLDPTSLILGALLGAIIGIGLDLYRKRPKLSINGGGSSGDSSGCRLNSLSVHNRLGWFGLRIPETKIFGFKVQPFLQLGLPFQKDDAIDCRAQLFIAETNEHIGQLYWGTPNGPVEDTKTIRSGESANLILFVSMPGNDRRYFHYQPVNKEAGGIKYPEEPAYFSGNMNFYIRINYSHTRSFIHKINISKKFDGKLYLEDKISSSFFRP